jgi:hypothetical protein
VFITQEPSGMFNCVIPPYNNPMNVVYRLASVKGTTLTDRSWPIQKAAISCQAALCHTCFYRRHCRRWPTEVTTLHGCSSQSSPPPPPPCSRRSLWSSSRTSSWPLKCTHSYVTHGRWRLLTFLLTLRFGPGWLSMATRYETDGPGNESQWGGGGGFSAPIQTGPGTMGTGSLSRK